MQWHYGNIGSAVAGLSALFIALAALFRGPAAFRGWKERQEAQASRQAEVAREQQTAARAQAEAAREQAETSRFDRQRHLSGWSAHGVDSFAVALAATDAERAQAVSELESSELSAYVILRMPDASRADSLRRLIETEGFIARPPTIGEREALEIGLDAMGIPRAAFGQVRPPVRNEANGQ